MKKIYILFLFIFSFVFFSGCGTDKDSNEGTAKKQKNDFYINTLTGKDLTKKSYIEKSGKISGAEDIMVTAQVPGKVQNIKVKDGDGVRKGELILTLNDTVGNYSTRLQNAKENLENAKINYNKTESSLEKTVSDAKLALEKTKQDLETAKDNSKESIKKAQRSLEDANIEDKKSNARNNLEETKKKYENAKLDYQNLLDSNQEQINSYRQSLKVYKSNLISFYDDFLFFSDKLLGITDANKNDNDDFEDYLGAKDTSKKNNAKNIFRDLSKILEELEEKNYTNIGSDKLLEEINYLDEIFQKSNNFLSLLEDVLNKSVTSSSFPQTQIDGYISQIQGYQTNYQTNYSSFVSSLKNPATVFLKTYKSKENSQKESINLLEQKIQTLKKQLESGQFNAEIGLQQTKITAQSNINNAKIGVENSEMAYNKAKENKELTLQSLQNSIKQAEIAYNEALRNHNRLYIKSPISGKVGSVKTDSGTEVSAGTPLVKIVSSGKQEIDLGFNSKELKYISQGDKVKIKYMNTYLTGEIVSISSVADQNFNYIVKIVLDKNLDLVGEFVKVIIPVKLQYTLIPMEYVFVTDDSRGYVYILSGNKVEKKFLKLGKTRHEKIQILSELPSPEKIIKTDMSNYNSDKFEFVVEK